MNTMATASQPSSCSRLAAAFTSSGSTAWRTVPSARVRSPTSSLMSRGTTGTNWPHRPQVCGRSRRRISRTSRKPVVVMTPVTAPLRSSRALVPTVVPWTTVDSAVRSPAPVSRPDRKPTAWFAGVDGTLATRAVPAASSRTKTSVKVPPTSTPAIRWGVLVLMLLEARWSLFRRGCRLRRRRPDTGRGPRPR